MKPKNHYSEILGYILVLEISKEKAFLLQKRIQGIVVVLERYSILVPTRTALASSSHPQPRPLVTIGLPAPQPHNVHAQVRPAIAIDLTQRQQQGKLPIPCCSPSSTPNQSFRCCREAADPYPARLPYGWCCSRDESTRRCRQQVGQPPYSDAAATSRECSLNRIETVVPARRGIGGQTR